MGEKLCINACLDRLEDDKPGYVLESGLRLFSDWIGTPFEFAVTTFETADFKRSAWTGVKAALAKGVLDGQLLHVYTSDGGFNAGMVTFENDQGLSLVRISVPSELILTLSLSAIENRCLEATTRLRAAARCSVLAGMELIVEPHGTLDETVLTELKGPTLAAIAVVPTALTPTLPREFLVRSAPYGLAMLRHIHAAERLHLA